MRTSNPSCRRHFLKVLLLVSLFEPLSACRGKPPSIDGHKFTVHTVVDQQQGGMPFLALMAPENWKVAGEVRWKYEDTSAPVTVFIRVSNPEKSEEVTFFPRTACYWLQGARAPNRPGTRSLGQIDLQPMHPADALRSAILKIYRPNLPDVKIIGMRQLPGLAAALKADPNTNQGVGIKIQYSINNEQIEEEFYALYYYLDIPYDGPQGHSVQTNWGLDQVHSFKAPLGTLDQHRDTFAFVVHSVQINPQWTTHAKAIQEQLNEQFNRNLAQGYASIAAAGARSRQISANNDAMIAGMDQQRAASNAASSASRTAPRSENDKFDDYVRGVDTMNDPYTGTSQHSSSEQYHWTDGYGNYAHSNDAGFNPNDNSNINWQQMTPAR